MAHMVSRKENGMRITRIEIEGAPGRYARLGRTGDSEFIEVEILCPDLEKTHHVRAANADDRWSMAECLQQTLDGHPGSTDMIHNYLRELERFAD